MIDIKRCMYCDNSYSDCLDEFCNIRKKYVDPGGFCDSFELSRFKIKMSLFREKEHEFPSNFCVLCEYYEKHEDIEYCRLEQHGWYCPLDSILAPERR